MPSKYTRFIQGENGVGTEVDVYDVLKAFRVECPATQHAVKKLLAPGQRGDKDIVQDLTEAQQSIERAIAMEMQSGLASQSPLVPAASPQKTPAATSAPSSDFTFPDGNYRG